MLKVTRSSLSRMDDHEVVMKVKSYQVRLADPGTFGCPTDVDMMPASPTVKQVAGTVTNTFW